MTQHLMQTERVMLMVGTAHAAREMAHYFGSGSSRLPSDRAQDAASKWREKASATEAMIEEQVAERERRAILANHEKISKAFQDQADDIRGLMEMMGG